MGERALRGWLGTPPARFDPIKSPFLLRLFFAHLGEAGAAHELVTAHRRQARELLGAWEAIDAELREEGGPLPPYLTLTYGIAYACAVLDWCDEVPRAARRGPREGRHGMSAGRVGDEVAVEVS